MSEQILWGTRIGDDDWQEELLLTGFNNLNVRNGVLIDIVYGVASSEINANLTGFFEKEGFNRLRVSVLDLTEKPDFAKTLKT